jgi:putative flippase GtrA
MALASSRIGAALIRKARSNVGVRFTRFTLVAVASVVASQVALSIFIGPAHMTAGISGGLAAIIGATVSYVLSRWAWERKGRPQLLKETLPFWLVSVGAWIILGLSAKLGVALAEAMEVDGIKRVLVTDGTYFAANCLTFVARFVIFHYVLFADPRSARDSAGRPEASGTAEPSEPTAAADAGRPPISSSSDVTGTPDDPFAMAADSGVPACADRGDGATRPTTPDLR